MNTLSRVILAFGVFLALALIISGHAILAQRTSMYGTDPLMRAAFLESNYLGDGLVFRSDTEALNVSWVVDP